MLLCLPHGRPDLISRPEGQTHAGPNAPHPSESEERMELDLNVMLRHLIALSNEEPHLLPLSAQNDGNVRKVTLALRSTMRMLESCDRKMDSQGLDLLELNLRDKKRSFLEIYRDICYLSRSLHQTCGSLLLLISTYCYRTLDVPLELSLLKAFRTCQILSRVPAIHVYRTSSIVLYANSLMETARVICMYDDDPLPNRMTFALSDELQRYL
jgi:hypothetical protein